MNKIKKLPAYRKVAIAVLLLVCSVIGAMSYKTVMKAATATKTVVYVYDSSYSNYVGIGNDPVYKTLTEQYDVKLFDVKDYNSEVGARFAESLRYNDLVFLSEAIGGTHKFGLACKNIVGKVPVVSMKSFFYTSGRWGWATPANPTKAASGWNKVKVNADYTSHPIFSGITLAADNTIALYDGTATDKNNVQGFKSPTADIAGDPILATNGADGNSAIHERKQADDKNGYLMIAMSMDPITTITDDAKKLLQNAVSYEMATSGGYTMPEQVAAPVITENGGTVTITCATEGATIYYSLNQAVTQSGTTYTSAVKLTESATVNAVAMKDGMLPSETASAKFEVKDDNGLEVITAPTVIDPERLDRGVVAYKVDGRMMVSWRLLATDNAVETQFNVYRNGVKVNEQPIIYGTNIIDPLGTEGDKYKVEAIGGETSEEVTALATPYINIQLNRPEGGVTKPHTSYDGSGNATPYPDGCKYDYAPGDISAADVDGDGEYELVLRWDPSNMHDNSQSGYTGNVYIDCYKLNGTKLWRIDLGENIRAGEHYTQFMVYDFDQDGKAELICKTAPGTKDGKGNYVIMGSDDPTKSYVNTEGKNTVGTIGSGPEYLTVFNGETGAEVTSIAYEPARGSSKDWGKDSYWNRSERYLACVAYLDGKRPSAVFCRGYYQRAAMVAYDFDGKNLIKRWKRDDKTAGTGCYGEGAHAIAVADVDQDGCDEIIFGSACVDHNGEMLYRTGFGHGDALHVGDLDPDRPGLEVFMVHEEKSSAYPYDAEMRDAYTGKVIWGLKQSGYDIGRGLAADCDSTSRGYEMWPIGDYSSGTRVNNVFDCKGNAISTKRPDVNFRIYWTGTLYDEILDGGKICQWQNTTTSAKQIVNLATTYNCGTVNGTKNVPNLCADILGDWREEVILYDKTTKANLMVFLTPFTSGYRIPTLMHDHTYRMAVCWQNVAYNQPPHLGYYLPDYGKKLVDDIKSFATGIQEITDNTKANSDNAIYNLQGQRVTTLKKGCIYIKKGKKFVF